MVPDGPAIVVANEFAACEVTKVVNKSGERLRVRSLTGKGIASLDPVVLELLAGLDNNALRALIQRLLDHST